MRRVVFSILLMLILCSVSLVSATVLKKMSVEDLTLAASSIVRGTVVDVKVEVNESNGRVYTYNTVLVSETVSGEVGKEIVIRQLGGKVGSVEMWISGTPRFEKGEEVLVFVKKEGDFYFLRGMGQGFFNIKTVNGQKMATQKLQDVAVFEQLASGVQGKVNPAQVLLLPLTKLLQQVRAYLKEATK